MNEKELEQLLKTAKVKPRSAWKHEVLARIAELPESAVTESSIRSKSRWIHHLNLLFNFSFMQNARIKLALGGGLLAVAFLGLGVYSLVSTQSTTKIETIALSAQEQQDIYTKILENNPTSLTTGVPTVTPGSTTAERKYNFIQSTLRVSAENATKTCAAQEFFGDINSSASITVAKNRQYYTNEASFYDSSNYNYDKKLINFYLTTIDRQDVVTYTYFGGKYAIKETAASYDFLGPAPDELNEDTTLSVDEQIAKLFGEGVQIIGKQSLNGKEYYVIEFHGEVYCDDSAEPSATLERGYVNAQSFTVDRTEIYLGSVAKDNLLYSTTYEVELTNISSDEAKQMFVFPFIDVEIRTIVQGETSQFDYEQMLADGTKSLQESKLTLLLLEEDGVYDSISFTEGQTVDMSGAEYMSDRDFYPAGELGDLMLERFKASIDASAAIYKANQTYAIGDENFTVTINTYDSSVSLEDMLREAGSNGENKKTQATISLDGKQKTVPMYTWENRFESADIDENGNEVNKQSHTTIERILIVEQGEYKYAIIIPGREDQELALSLLKFHTVDTTTPAGYTEVLNWIKESIEQQRQMENGGEM